MTLQLSCIELHSLAAFITNNGGEVLPPTNPYEIARVVVMGKILVAHQNLKGQQTWPDDLLPVIEACRANRNMPLGQRTRLRGTRASRRRQLMERDGALAATPRNAPRGSVPALTNSSPLAQNRTKSWSWLRNTSNKKPASM